MKLRVQLTLDARTVGEPVIVDLGVGKPGVGTSARVQAYLNDLADEIHRNAQALADELDAPALAHAWPLQATAIGAELKVLA